MASNRHSFSRSNSGIDSPSDSKHENGPDGRIDEVKQEFYGRDVESFPLTILSKIPNADDETLQIYLDLVNDNIRKIQEEQKQYNEALLELKRMQVAKQASLIALRNCLLDIIATRFFISGIMAKKFLGIDDNNPDFVDEDKIISVSNQLNDFILNGFVHHINDPSKLVFDSNKLIINQETQKKELPKTNIEDFNQLFKNLNEIYGAYQLATSKAENAKPKINANDLNNVAESLRHELDKRAKDQLEKQLKKEKIAIQQMEQEKNLKEELKNTINDISKSFKEYSNNNITLLARKKTALVIEIREQIEELIKLLFGPNSPSKKADKSCIDIARIIGNAAEACETYIQRNASIESKHTWFFEGDNRLGKMLKKAQADLSKLSHEYLSHELNRINPHR